MAIFEKSPHVSVILVKTAHSSREYFRIGTAAILVVVGVIALVR